MFTTQHPGALRAVTLAYTLRNGHRGTMTCVARNTADAVGVAIDTFGDQLRSCAARPLVASTLSARALVTPGARP